MIKYKLKDLLSIKNGCDYRHLGQGIIPVYGTGGIMTYVDKFLYDGESILLPRKGSLDNITYVDGRFWTVDTMYWTIINTDLVYPKFLYYYLSLLDLSCRDSGSTLPSMTFDAYYDLEINLPDLLVQKKILQCLTPIDDKIENNKKINNILEEQARALYEYWFTQFDFPNEEGKSYRSSGGKMIYCNQIKREIPEGWGVINTNEIVTWKSNSQPPKNQFIYHPMDGYIRFIQNRDYESDGYITYIPNNKNITKCDRFDILIDKYGDAGRVRYGIEGAFNVALAKLEVKNIEYLEYVRSYFEDNSIYNYLHNSCMASTRASLNESNIDNLNIVIPPNYVIKKYNDILIPLRKKILLNHDENRKLILTRDLLLPLLMNGQVKIYN